MEVAILGNGLCYCAYLALAWLPTPPPASALLLPSLPIALTGGMFTALSNTRQRKDLF